MSFIAAPPQPIPRGTLRKHIWRMICSLGYIVWQIVVPFKSRPEDISEFPEPPGDVTEEQVEQSKWIFAQSKERRDHLEQKAQSTFGLMLFLVPLLTSLFVFIISKSSTPGIAIHPVIIILLILSSVFLLLGFVSAVRAISVKAIETLYLYAVIDNDGKFLEYNKSNHARGLLYCAAMNEAMNDHLAQFVKGAHYLSVAAVFSLIIAAIPICFVLSGLHASPVETRIVGQIDISSSRITGIQDDVTKLKADIKTLANSKPTENDFKLLQEKVKKLDEELTMMQKSISPAP
jgi:hypothetical protein